MDLFSFFLVFISVKLSHVYLLDIYSLIFFGLGKNYWSIRSEFSSGILVLEGISDGMTGDSWGA